MDFFKSSICSLSSISPIYPSILEIIPFFSNYFTIFLLCSNPEGVTPIDFVSAKYLLKKGEKLETIQYKPIPIDSLSD
tara:strand:- start:1129 stop:1362 length:234 start_codon:yes stop_codon:yes gene_type:complete